LRGKDRNPAVPYIGTLDVSLKESVARIKGTTVGCLFMICIRNIRITEKDKTSFLTGKHKLAMYWKGEK
jgi:hypothetical protein